jgi:hypothetical protein
MRGLIARVVSIDFNALEELRRPLVHLRIVKVFKLGHLIT